MTTTRFSSPAMVLAITLAGALVSLPPTTLAAAPGSGAALAQQDNGSSEVAGKLNKSQYKDVKVSVDNGIATLTGTVSLYEYKMDAENRVRKAKGVSAVRNEIQVAGPNVSDQELKKKLAEKLTYDSVGYGHLFDAITIDVQNGVVTLGGHVHNYVDRNSALALANTFPGVKQVNDEMEVDPTSIMDDQIRLEVARAVYGYATLNKYAIDPAKPIRISVQNGHVELYGEVDSQADKDVAFLRANGVPGVFSVKNYIQVAGQTSETPNGQAKK